MSTSMPMIPGLEGHMPGVVPFLPGSGMDEAALPEARFREVVELEDGDTLSLKAMLVRRTIKGRTFTMYGFNRQYPGPLVKVDEDATIVVDFTNELDLPTTVHWHGVRLNNRFDGVPGVTQDPVEPGETFEYRVHFPDPGVYWYHPHIREDIQQDLGLYGNILVRSPDADYYNPVNREEVLMLDDLLIDSQGLIPWGKGAANHALMGRFGNQMLVNGEAEYGLSVDLGDVVRFYLTNVSNTRNFNLTFGGAPIKVVAGDVSKFEREQWASSVFIAPAQRYVVEVRFRESGEVPLTNSIQALDHFRGEFYPRVDTLGMIAVSAEPTEADHAASFQQLRENRNVQSDIAQYRKYFDQPVDHELRLTIKAKGLPSSIMQIMAIDTVYVPPVAVNDAMPLMNWLSTVNEVRWILRDAATGRENGDIEWRFPAADAVKLRLFNEPRSLHPMSHPIHLHGQRFLVLEKDGKPNANLVWKDTVIVPVGSTVDILVDMSNPGEWALHCHIAEHLEAGMMMTFTVEPLASVQ